MSFGAFCVFMWIYAKTIYLKAVVANRLKYCNKYTINILTF